MRVLLLDTSFAAAPIYDFLLSAGHEVWVAGHRESDLLARRAGNRWLNLDYSDVSAVESNISQHRIERVVPGCTDVSLQVTLQLSVMRGVFDSPNVNAVLANKAMFRRECIAADVKAPKVIEDRSLPRAGQFICKPVDAFSGRGCSVFDGSDTQALRVAVLAAQDASPTKQFLIEEFIEGQLFSCSGFMVDSQLQDVHYVIEGSSVNRYAVDTSYVTRDLSLEVRQELEESLCRLSQRLRMKDGLLHTQFILGTDGAHVVEVSRRCPGDLYPLLIEYSTGYRYAARYASFFTDDKVVPTTERNAFVLRHTVASERQTTYSGLRFVEPLQLIAQFPIIAMGETLWEAQKSRAEILFCQVHDPMALAKLYRQFVNRDIYKFNG